MDKGTYGLMTFAIGLALGLAGRAGLRLAVVLALLVTAGGAYAGPRRPAVHLRLWPCRGECFLMAPASIEARVIVTDPDRALRCPSYEFEWEKGGERSGQEETSCDPFAPDDRTPTEYRLMPRRHTYRTGGVHRVTVTVRGGERRATYTAHKDVHVRGPQLEIVE